jgi:hypothetical protein
MVVFSSVLNFLFRSPELASTIFLYIILVGNNPYVFRALCVGYSDCLLIGDLANSFLHLLPVVQLLFLLLLQQGLQVLVYFLVFA